MTLFNPKSLNPAAWFSRLMIIVSLQHFALHGFGCNYELANVAAIEIAANEKVLSLIVYAACDVKIVLIHQTTSIVEVSDTQLEYLTAEVTSSSKLSILGKRTSSRIAQLAFIPKVINEKMLESFLLSARTSEKGKVKEKLFLNTQQSKEGNWLIYFLILATIIFICCVLYRAESSRRTAFTKSSERIAREFQNDIGSNSAAISVLAEVAELTLTNSGDIENTCHLLRKIRSLSGKVIEDADEILWSLALKNNQLEEVSKRMRILGGRLEEHGINFALDVKENHSSHKFDIETRNHFYVIFKEIVTNIAKHANCKNAKAKLSFKEFVELIVIDDGIGFDVQKNYQGNGFHIVRSRCKQLNANLSIMSKKGGGTTIKVIFAG